MGIAQFGQLFLRLPRGIKKPIKLSESAIERSICDYLTYQGFDVIKIPSSGYFDAARKRFRKHASPYVRNGIPDLLALKPGTIYWFEVKSLKGVQSEAQKDMEKLFLKNGQKYFIVRSVKDVEDILKGEL